MNHYVSDIDYTQPFESRGPLGMKFHYFLTVLAGINTLIMLLGLLSSFWGLGISALTICLFGLAINGLLFGLLLKKSHFILIYYKIYFWVALVIGVASVLWLPLIITGFLALIGIELSATLAALIGTMTIPGFIGVGIASFINYLVIKYYKKRIHLLN